MWHFIKSIFFFLECLAVVYGVEQKGSAAEASGCQACAGERRMTPCADLCCHLVAARR